MLEGAPGYSKGSEKDRFPRRSRNVPWGVRWQYDVIEALTCVQMTLPIKDSLGNSVFIAADTPQFDLSLVGNFSN